MSDQNPFSLAITAGAATVTADIAAAYIGGRFADASGGRAAEGDNGSRSP